MKTRIRSFFMAMLLVLSLVATAMATETDAAAGIDLQAERRVGELAISVYLTAENATNGRICIEYDADATLVDIKAVCDGLTSVNSEEEGKVFFAWVGANCTGTVKVLELVFQDETTEQVTGKFTGTVSELYSNGTDLLAGQTVTKTLEIKEIVPGDMNDDGITMPNDVVSLLKALASKGTNRFVWAEMVAADVNDDGRINTRDAILALKSIAAMDPAAAK